MAADQRIIDRFDELLEKGDEVARTYLHPSGTIGDPLGDSALATEWVLSALSLVGRVAGKESEHYGTIAGSQRLIAWRSAFTHAMAGLKSARDDYSGGWLVDFKELAAGEVFSDFLDMAAHLCDNGYHIPGASLAGAVLEDALRRLHLKHIGAWSGDSKISKLNGALHKANVYPQPQWRQIQTWGDIRNEADHRNFDKVDAGDVARMVPAIRDFIVKYST